MNCTDFREIIDSYLSDELLTETNHGVLRHMEGCGNCRGEIEARREIRGRLKAAVMSSPHYQIDEQFASNLRMMLTRSVRQSNAKTTSWISRKSWVAVAAGLLVVFAIGFFVANRVSVGRNQIASITPSVSSLQRDDLVNVALGDHEHCAIRHDLKDPTFSLEKASAKYKDLDKIVVPSLGRILSKYQFVMAHGCTYEDTQFAHVVLKGEGKTLSVLIADLKDFGDLKGEEILKFSSTKPEYHVAKFNTKTHAIFVISDMDENKNFEALKALSVPLTKHLDGSNQFQTAILSFY